MPGLDPSLIDRAVIVTGGSRGIGREIALGLIKAGARVAIGATAASAHLDATVKAAEAIAGPGRVLPVIGDIRQIENCARIARDVLNSFGAIHVLFNNAAVPVAIGDSTYRRAFWEVGPEKWLQMVDTNINGLFLITRVVVLAMLAQRFGKIINLSTNDRTMARRNGSPYGPSKAFVEAASRIWAQDLEGSGVTVNVLVPGGSIDTRRQTGPETPRDPRSLPVAIMRAPVLWLASDLANGHTGERFVATRWNEELPLAQRIAAARDDGAALPRIM
jgi:NAD(P)-dependent dehydrogenase (short-subunit alcohol dehydrogenase family)